MGGLFGEFSNPDNSFVAGLLYEPPGLEELFKDVIFEGAQPHCIKLKNEITVRDGILEVHFRDSQHLRSLIEQTPMIEAKKVYFVHDRDAQMGKEFVASSGILQAGKFIHLMADGPLVPQGRLSVAGCTIVFPGKSDVNQLSHDGKNLELCTSLSSYDSTLTLANILENFDHKLLNARTKEAQTLFEDRRRDRINHPEKYPSLAQLAPNACLCSDGPRKIKADDFLDADSPIVYIAPSITKIEQLVKQLKPFLRDSHVFLIDSDQGVTGVYSNSPLALTKTFIIETEKNFLIGGTLERHDYSFILNIKEDFWIYGSLHGKSVQVHAKSLSLMGQEYSLIRAEGIPLSMWQEYRGFLYNHYGI